ncbi:XdhC family protein [Neobacillus vireti]|uniref:XdhC family protein n=1 Tax=Neobacillus vireti TaxID=220686 RepID=UPI002FFF54B3
MPTLFRILDALQLSPIKSILATIIRIDGSAYLKEGTSMLMMENGERIGMISPGCLEEDLFLRSKELFQSPYPQVVTYDLSSVDDYGWGQGMGCNGVIKILLEPITEKLRTDLFFLKKSLEKGLSVLHEKVFSDDYTFKKSTFQIVSKKDIKNHHYEFQPINEGYKYSYLFTPAPRILLFGAGEDAKPFVSLASKIGFTITLCDWRPGLCHESHFPSANQFIIGSPLHIIHSIHFSKNDYIVIMSHNFLKDQEFLAGLKNSEVNYIGILGSKERTTRLLGGGEYPNNLYFPVGLPIGAQGPEEIAVSIMAQIIQLYRNASK